MLVAPSDAEGPLNGLGLSVASNLGGYLVAETLLFRSVNAVEDPYLHIEHITEVNEWFDAEGQFVSVVDINSPSDADTYKAGVTITHQGVQVMKATATLRRGGLRGGRAAKPAATGRNQPTSGEELGKWAVQPDSAFRYSEWCHPNLHTDASMARSMGFETPLAQGLMVQNKALLLCADRYGISIPFSIHSRFRSPIAVGAPLVFVSERDGSDVMVSVVDDGRIAVSVRLSLADGKRTSIVR